jgi:hypothetical protein
MINVITRTIVAQYYRINTGFFLVSFVLLFGLLSGKATMDLHYYIMQSITNSYLFALAAMGVWLMYNFKCLSYCIKEINKSENSFLYTLQSINSSIHFLLWVAAHTLLLSPVLTYATITIIIGITKGQYVLSILFALFQMLLIATGALIYYKRINSTWIKPLITLPRIFEGGKKHFYTYLLHYSLSMRRGTFSGIKILSLLLLQAMIAINENVINKESVCVLMMFLISAHSLLPAYYVGFIEEQMSFMRNMPVPVTKQLLLYVVTYAVIFLPELLFLLLNGHHAMPLELTLVLYAVAVSQMTLYTSLQYIHNLQTERYTMIVFVIFFATLLFLASFNLWILFFVEAALAVIIFLSLHNKFEKL